MKTILALLICLGVVGISGCSESSTVRTSQYTVIDSGAWTYNMGLNKTYWLDNERVLFVSTKTFAPGGGSSLLTVWTPATGTIEPSHEIVNLVCAEEEQVFFVTKDQSSETSKYKYYRGPLERPVEYPPPSKGMRSSSFFDCGWAFPSGSGTVPYKINLKGDNYLEVIKQPNSKSNSNDEHGEVRYFEGPNYPSTNLPVYAVPTGTYDIKYDVHTDRYFISPGKYYPDNSYYHSMWWLSRSGQISPRESFPQQLPWSSSGTIDIYPLKKGYMIQYMGGDVTMTSVGPRGVYFMTGDFVETVLWGTVHGVSISPDGCSAAFIYARNTEEFFSREKPYRTLRAINFCEQD